MEPGKGNQGSHVPREQFGGIEILEEAADCREFARLAARVVREDLPVLLIIGEIFEVFFNILFTDLLQNVQGIFADLHSREGSVFFLQKFEKDPQVIGVGQPCAGPCRPLDPAEILSAETGQVLQNLPHFFRVADLLRPGIFFGFCLFVHSHRAVSFKAYRERKCYRA